MKTKALQECLEEIKSFENPKINLEQYMTPPHIASIILSHIKLQGSLEGKYVADLGCGTGMLSIGASLMGAEQVLGIDIDPDALKTFKANVDEMNLTNIDALNLSIEQCKSLAFKFDTVILNPPFGTQNSAIDMEFVKIALTLTNGLVYSLHKKSVHKRIERTAAELGFKANFLADITYDLNKTYKKHKKDSRDIEVQLVEFSTKKKKLKKNIRS